MTFLNFSQFPESVFRPNFSGKHFPGNQANFFFDWKVFFIDWKLFSLTNFPNDKQTQESLESGFPKSEFQETNITSEFIERLFWALQNLNPK
jgi:hypothetical protein